MHKPAVFNPHNKPIEKLPIIYGFNNGGSPGFFEAVLISADGHLLGGHCCSHESFMWGDLGILEGSRSDRHEEFRKYYPEGYRMEFVGFDAVNGHAGLQSAFKKYKELDNAATETQPPC